MARREHRATVAHARHWFAPRAAIALFVLALLGFLWVLHRQELDEKRSAVIRDILWLEQNIRFSLTRDVEQLRQLGADSGPAPGDEFALRSAYFLQNSSGLQQLVLLDDSGRVRASVPGRDGGARKWPAQPAFQLARSTGMPRYGAAYEADGELRFDVFVPYYDYDGGRTGGIAVGVYSVQPMLAALVPWWLAEKHLVTVRDASGALRAAKSNVAARQPELSHRVPLDPPGHGLLLEVESYSAETQLLRNALAAAIIVLAIAVLWNLRALRRHVQRRLATEEALRTEHAFRKAMEDSLHTGMAAVDLDGRVVYANLSLCNMVGYSESELVGSTPPYPYWPPESRARIEGALRAARAPGAPREGIEMKLVRRNGERFDALLFEAPLIDAAGKQTGWMGSLLDITERKRARELARQQEEKLAASARLVTVGEMASTIAHELNQPLSAIASYTTGCLNLLESRTFEPADLEEALRRTAQQAQRAGRIIRRVHDFVRKSEPLRQPVRMNAVIEEAVGFAEAEARKRRVRIQARLTEDDREFQADPLLLQQVVLNLLRNAMDAMSSTPPDDREILVASEAGESSVTVSIADRGCGIPPEIEEQLFQPFFTTKPEGMGMGLSICRSIMEFHRGRVWAEPNPRGGTVFSFSLPMEEAP